MTDQAANLRILAEGHKKDLESVEKKYRTIVVVSGKGGVGKSFLSLNLAFALGDLGAGVLLVDANLQNPGLHILTNTDPVYPINYWVAESVTVEQSAIISLNQNVDFLGNSLTIRNHKRYLQENANIFMELLMPLASQYDYLILDQQTGLGQWNLSLLIQADLCLMVTITDPTSVIDTYTMLKATTPYFPVSKYRLVINQNLKEEEGRTAHNNLNLALNHFLNQKIDLLEMIPFDPQVRYSFDRQKALWEVGRRSDALKKIQNIAKSIRSHFTEKKVTHEEVIL